MRSNLVLTATFLSPSIPGAIAFTYPPLEGNTPNGTFSLQGTVSGLLTPPVSLTCQLFSYTNQSPAGRVLQTTGRTNYMETGLALGVDLLVNPELLAEPDLAARSAAWFWT